VVAVSFWAVVLDGVGIGTAGHLNPPHG
jgi:hypothetical protein